MVELTCYSSSYRDKVKCYERVRYNDMMICVQRVQWFVCNEDSQARASIDRVKPSYACAYPSLNKGFQNRYVLPTGSSILTFRYRIEYLRSLVLSHRGTDVSKPSSKVRLKTPRSRDHDKLWRCCVFHACFDRWRTCCFQPTRGARIWIRFASFTQMSVL